MAGSEWMGKAKDRVLWFNLEEACVERRRFYSSMQVYKDLYLDLDEKSEKMQALENY